MMEYKELYKLDDMNWFDRSITIMKLFFSSSEVFIVGVILLMVIIFVVAMIMRYVHIDIMLKPIVATPFVVVVYGIVLFSLCLILSYKNIGVGYYEAEVKPQKVEAVETMDNNYKSKVEIKDDDNKTLNLEYIGKKIDKADKITVRTKSIIVNKDDPKEYKFDIDSDENETYLYNGKELEATDVGLFFRKINK